MSRFEDRAAAYKKNPAPVDYFTVSYRCAMRGIQLSRGGVIQAGRRAAKRYREVHGEPPPRSPEVVLLKDGVNKAGREWELLASTYVYAYGAEDLELLDEAIDHASAHYG